MASYIVPARPHILTYKIISGRAGPNYDYREKVKNLLVYATSPAVFIIDDDDLELKPEYQRCYQVQFHACVLEGRLKGVDVLITRRFESPMKNVLNGVLLDWGMVAKVSGELYCFYWENRERVPVCFDVQATRIVRGPEYREGRMLYEKSMRQEKKIVQLHHGRDGAFDC